ncbi:MAG: PAS domain S-box protein, partial [Methanobacterium sp.]|nr:PAS domain S-box protein [Methanobacterium sp.]
MEANQKDLELKKLRERVVELEKSLKEFQTLKETSREQESELHQIEQRFSQVAESAGEWIWEIDAQGMYTYSSPAVESIIGYTPDEIVGKKYFYQLIVPESCERLKEAAFKIFRERKFFKDLKIPNLHKDGSKVISEASGVPIISEDNQFLGYRGLDFDITHRDMYEKALKKSERQLQDIIDHLPDATLAINLDGEVIAWNKAIEEMTGVKAADIMGKANYEYAIPFYDERRPILIDLIFKSEEEIKEMHYLGIHKEGKALMAETTLPTPRGIKSYLWGKASPLYDENGELMGAVESIRDITHRKKAERELQKSKDRFQQVVENAEEWIWEVDEQGLYTYSSPVVEKILGYTPDEIVGKKHFYDFFPSDEREYKMKSAFKIFEKRESFSSFINHNIHKNGERVILETSGVPFYDEHKEFIGYRGVDND